MELAAKPPYTEASIVVPLASTFVERVSPEG